MLGEEQKEKLLSENEVDPDPIASFRNEPNLGDGLGIGLNSFLCSYSMSNLSLANFIKLSRVTTIVSPAQQIKHLESANCDKLEFQTVQLTGKDNRRDFGLLAFSPISDIQLRSTNIYTTIYNLMYV